jgi:hypothetical protein
MPTLRFLRLLLAGACLIGAAVWLTAQASPAPKARKQVTAKSPTPKKATPTGSVSFEDVARASGIDFHLTCGSLEKRYIIESVCGGIAVFDYDNDGWMDIFLVNGSTLEDLSADKCHPSKLYRNNHNGTFTETTAKAGLTHCGWGFGVAVGDYDNDGWEDLYITYLQGAVLYHNNRDGTLTDVTATAGAGNPGSWGTSAAFGDYDNDGYLDLYVANYVQLGLDNLPPFGGQLCRYRGIPVFCGPLGLQGARDRLYHNNGNGTFTDVTEQLHIDPWSGYRFPVRRANIRGSNYGMGVLWLDYDLDGCLDLYVADDSSPSMLFHNDCKGGLTEVGAEAGVAYNSDGRVQAGMGIDSADYDNDGWPDIVKTNFSDDMNNLYHNDHNGQFTDMAGPAGFGPISVPFLAFGVKFFDFDNDGWKDIFVANGHVNPQVDEHTFGVTYAERSFLFHNLRDGKFEEIGLNAGSAMTRPYVARGTATADFLNNGSEDLLISVLDGSPLLLRTEAAKTGHWLRIKTVGTRSNRDGFGARVEVKAGGLTQTAEVRANSSFESACDPRLHFGLGSSTRVDTVVIHWPSGKVENLGPEKADQELVVEEGRGVVARHPGSRAVQTSEKRP